MKYDNIEKLTKDVLSCKDCDLHLNRTQVVPGIYGKKKSVCFIGEAPGFNEDKEGLPFVGRSGKLLDKMLTSIGLSRKEISILNIVKCRPIDEKGGNRTPTPKEANFCGQKWLFNQIHLLEPKILVSLGAISFNFFFPSLSLTNNIGKTLQTASGNSLFVTYHPAYILRRPTPDLLEKYSKHFEIIATTNDLKKETKDYPLQPKRIEQKRISDFF